MSKKVDIEKLKAVFIENAVLQGKATLEGKPKKGNRGSNKMFKIESIMKEDREIAIPMLDILLEHDDVSVKLGQQV